MNPSDQDDIVTFSQVMVGKLLSVKSSIEALGASAIVQPDAGPVVVIETLGRSGCGEVSD